MKSLTKNDKTFFINHLYKGAAVSGFTSVFLSTIERRFNLNSFQVSFISVGYDVASIFSLIPISYFGGKGHKPKWIAGGTLLMG